MKTVLVVDDNAAIRMIISDFLTLNYAHLNVQEAIDGIEGIARVEEGLPDLILLDAEMPNMNGYEVVKKLKASQETEKIPIIAISSGATNNPIVSGLRAMSDASLPKPFTPEELIDVVKKVCPSTHISA